MNPSAGFFLWMLIFHAIRFTSAFQASVEGWTLVKSPSNDTPLDSLLKPPVCAAITALSIPPWRPSKIWPNRSMMKLYAMSQ